MHTPAFQRIIFPMGLQAKGKLKKGLKKIETGHWKAGHWAIRGVNGICPSILQRGKGYLHWFRMFPGLTDWTCPTDLLHSTQAQAATGLIRQFNKTMTSTHRHKPCNAQPIRQLSSNKSDLVQTTGTLKPPFPLNIPASIHPFKRAGVFHTDSSKRQTRSERGSKPWFVIPMQAQGDAVWLTHPNHGMAN